MSTFKRKRSYSNRPTKRRKTIRRPCRTNMRRQMRKTFMSMVEIEEKKYSHIKFESYLNANPVYCNINGTLQNPDDSESSIQRIGDEIQQLGFNVKMTFYNKQDRPNVAWKVRVVSTPRTYYTDGSGNSGTFPKT